MSNLTETIIRLETSFNQSSKNMSSNNLSNGNAEEANAIWNQPNNTF